MERFTTKNAADETMEIEIREEFGRFSVYKDGYLKRTADNYLEAVAEVEDLEKQT